MFPIYARLEWDDPDPVIGERLGRALGTLPEAVIGVEHARHVVLPGEVRVVLFVAAGTPAQAQRRACDLLAAVAASVAGVAP